MKKRRIVIASFLFLAVLVMSIGFAALTDNLFIKGEATLATTSAQSNFDDDVFFTEVSKVESTGSNTGEDTVAIGQTDNDSATFKIMTLGNKDEYVTFKFTIRNNSEEFDAIISLDSGFPTTTDSTHFAITYSIEANVSNEGPITCDSGDTVDVYVTVRLLSSPAENQTAAFNVNLTATSAPSDANEAPEDPGT